MPFSTFNLFGDISRNYINTEAINQIGKAVHIAADNIFGLIPGGTLTNLVRFGIGNFGFIVDTVTGEKMIFQYNVTGKESGGAEWTSQLTLGRSVPHLHYNGGKTRQLELPITFTMKEFTRDDVRRNVRWLQGLAYPDYETETEVSRTPHTIVVVQGKLYAQDLWVVNDFNISWGEVIDPITKLPSEATVNLTLSEVSQRGKSRGDLIFL